MYLFQKLYIYQPESKSREGIYENITEFLRFENKYDSIDHMIPNISTKIKKKLNKDIIEKVWWFDFP